MRSTTIRAKIIGDHTCAAEGVTAHGASPVLQLSRLLVNAVFDPAAPLEAYRGDVLCLRVRAIGEAAGLEINSNGTGFVRHRAVRAAPPVRKSRPVLVQVTPRLASKGGAS